MPRLWSDTIEDHRRTVRDAILDAAGALVAEQGLASVTMSAIAGRTGIGRATLYKYFADVEVLLQAWHDRQVTGHVEHLVDVSGRTGPPADRLEAALLAYAAMSRHSDGGHLAELLHRGGHVAEAQQRLRNFLRDLIAEGARAGELRDDVPPAELAEYVLGALSAAGRPPSEAAVRRRVAVTLDGLRRRT